MWTGCHPLEMPCIDLMHVYEYLEFLIFLRFSPGRHPLCLPSRLLRLIEGAFGVKGYVELLESAKQAHSDCIRSNSSSGTSSSGTSSNSNHILVQFHWSTSRSTPVTQCVHVHQTKTSTQTIPVLPTIQCSRGTTRCDVPCSRSISTFHNLEYAGRRSSTGCRPRSYCWE